MSESSQLDFATVGETDSLQEMKSPVCVQVARTNIDAQLKAILLKEAGIRAVAVDDISLAGYYALGTIDALHRPRIYVDKSQLAAAQSILAQTSDGIDRDSLEGYCYHCGAQLPGGQLNSSCPDCHQQIFPAEEDDRQGSSDQVISRGRWLFQSIRAVGVILFSAYCLLWMLHGLYALYLMISGPLRW